MKQLRWMKLDNAAKIFPAARRKNWTNVFRLSVTFIDEIEPGILQEALNRTIKRFPSVAVRVRTGMFWYYLEEIPEAPKIIPEEECSLNRMRFSDIKKCAFRVMYHNKRMSVEIFHSVTDGNGGLVFIKTLAAEYVRLRYKESVPCSDGILDINQTVDEGELQDSFGKFAAPTAAGRKEENAYLLTGTKEPDSFLHVTTGIINVDEIKNYAKKYNVTLTVFLAAVMMNSIYEIQNERIVNKKKLKAIRILVPVNLRKLFESNTMRNFAMYITTGIDPKLGQYTFEEMINEIYHNMGLELNPKKMAAKFTANVRSERSKILRIMPLFVKNIAMKLVYNCVGEKKASICMSNLGNIELPKNLSRYVSRIEFIIGVQADSPCNCSICAYGGKMYVNFIRNIKESELERKFFTFLRRQGIHVLVESNQR